MLGFSSIVGYYWRPSIPGAPAWLHGLENVPNIYIRKVMSNIWVKYQFWVNCPFSCLTFFPCQPAYGHKLENGNHPPHLSIEES